MLVISKTAGILAPVLFKQAIDAVSSGTSKAALSNAVAALLVGGAARAINGLAKELQHPLFTPVSQAAGRRVSHHAFAHVLGLDLGFHLDRSVGSLSRMLERGARSVGMIFRAIVFTFVPTIVELIAVCVILARAFSPLISGLVMGAFGIYAGWTVLLTFLATKVRREVKDLDNLISSQAVDALLNVETVKLFANDKLEAERYDAGLTAYQKASVQLEVISAALNAGQGAILAAGMTAAMVAAALAPGTTAGDLVMIQGLLLQLWAPLQFLGWFYRELRQSLVDMEDLFDILRMQPLLADGTIELPDDIRGISLKLENVKYTYPGTGREVLRGINIFAAPGESIAIVGPSGSGKSTILKLLTRLYDCDADGSVFIDGIDVRDLKLSSLRAVTAVVPQDTILFNDKISDNIAYGKPNASKEEIVSAARAAKLTGAVASMPDGWNTIVGERGLKLSGGEKQRVAIARAFLRAPRLIICDEATSALDTATERSIMASLTELAAGRTSVFVAHRLSTVQGCSRIYVLNEGKVAEQGNHEHLMNRKGLYYEQWQAQAAEEVRSKLVKSGSEDWERLELEVESVVEEQEAADEERISEASR